MGSGTVCNPNCRFDWIGLSVEDGTFLSEANGLTDLRSSIGPTAGIEELGQGYGGKEPNDRNHNHQLHKSKAPYPLGEIAL
jgi:hypothetical protein